LEHSSKQSICHEPGTANHGAGHVVDAVRPQTTDVSVSFALRESPKLSISFLRESHEPFLPGKKPES